jgi:hypothetical protein
MTLDEAVRKRDWKLFICAEDIRLATQYLEETARPKPDEDDNVRFLRRAVVYLGREFLAGRFSYDPECKSMTWLGLKSMWLCVWTPYNVVAHNLALFVDKLPTAADINGAN